MTRRPVSEPLTIDAGVVAEHLEDEGRPLMAAFVRTLDSAVRSNDRDQQRLRDQIADLAARLERHEPRVVATFVPGRPPAEATD